MDTYRKGRYTRRMVVRKAGSLSLVVWVAVLCPALCGLRLAASDSQAVAPGCCGQCVPMNQGSDTPVPPLEQGAEVCFCSGQGLAFEKADPIHAALLPSAFLGRLPGDGLPTLRPVIDASRRLCFHPPDAERVLPLLI